MADHADIVRKVLDLLEEAAGGWSEGNPYELAVDPARAALVAERDNAVALCEAATRDANAAEAQLSDMELRFKVASFDSKLWERIEVAESGCWEWRGYRGPHGYGQVSLGSAHLRAHRATYEAVHGPIPAGLQIDHLCRNIGCVNPAHLEAVTARENTMRSEAVTAQNARKTQCVRGHDFTPENTILSKKGRECRTCHNERSRLRKRRLRALAAEETT